MSKTFKIQTLFVHHHVILLPSDKTIAVMHSLRSKFKCVQHGQTVEPRDPFIVHAKFCRAISQERSGKPIGNFSRISQGTLSASVSRLKNK